MMYGCASTRARASVEHGEAIENIGNIPRRIVQANVYPRESGVAAGRR